MGELFLAETEGAGGWRRQLVIKRILPHLAVDPSVRQRFLDEGRIAATLNHANIVPVHDVGEVEGTPFIAMAFVDGWDLRTVIRALRDAPGSPPVPDGLALHVASHVAAALAHAHDRRDPDGRPMEVVHRDVSPANILLSREGAVFLTDFGIAAANERIEATLTGELKGKVAFMAPEQARGAPTDGRSDIHSLGLVLFELLTGRRAYGDGSDLELLDRARAGTRPALSDLRPDLPDTITAVIEKALAVDPSERFDDAAQFAAALVEAQAALGRVHTALDLRSWLAKSLPSGAPSTADARGTGDLEGALGALGAAPAALREGSGTVTLPPPVNLDGSAGTAPPDQVASAAPARNSDPRRTRRGGALLLAGALILVALALALLPSRPATLHVSTDPPGASITLNGENAGRTDRTLRIPSGNVRLRVHLDGYVPVSRELALRPGQDAFLDLPLEPERTTPPSTTNSRTPDASRSGSDEAADAGRMERVVFQSIPPGARVRIDDGEPFLAGNAHPVPLGVPVSLVMSLDGHETLEEVLTLQRGDLLVTRALDADPSSTRVESSPPARPRTQDRPSPPPSTSAPASTTAAGSESPEPATPGRITLRFSREPMVGTILLNGEVLRQSRRLVEELEVAPGRHELEIRNDHFGVRQRNRVEVPSGGAVTVSVDWGGGGP